MIYLEKLQIFMQIQIRNHSYQNLTISMVLMYFVTIPHNFKSLNGRFWSFFIAHCFHLPNKYAHNNIFKILSNMDQSILSNILSFLI